MDELLSPLMEIAQPCGYLRECFVCASATAKKALDRGPSPATTHSASLLTAGRVVDEYVPTQHGDSVEALTAIMKGMVTDCHALHPELSYLMKTVFSGSSIDRGVGQVG